MASLKRPIGSPSDIQPLCVSHYTHFIMHAADISFSCTFQPGELQQCLVISLCMDPSDLDLLNQCLPCKWGITEDEIKRALLQVQMDLGDEILMGETNAFMRAFS